MSKVSNVIAQELSTGVGASMLHFTNPFDNNIYLSTKDGLSS